ncbi:MAG: undecaprenyl-diphosphatase UppP [Anaerolineales bacterium]|nr:undecaprenyl-diphosphatase UppP [Anaerolineales bacterium]
MDLLQALLLGIIQGLTEFLPISSSAHLVLVPWLLGWRFDPKAKFVFDVLVQNGTLVAVITYFWKDLLYLLRAVLTALWQQQPFATPDARLGWFVALATVPAVVLGFLFKDFFESVFASPPAVAALLLLTAALLAFSERYGQRLRDLTTLTWLDALIIGLMQALAILPGVSRSGATMAGGLARGLDRPAAARFSFLMSVPVMLGAGLVALNDLLAIPNFSDYVLPVSTGFIAAAVVGYLSIGWLLAFLRRRSFYGFAVYCAAASAACLMFGLLAG